MTERLSLLTPIGLLLAALPVSSQTPLVPQVDVYDSASNLQAIFTYFETNPSNTLGAGALGFGAGQMTSK